MLPLMADGVLMRCMRRLLDSCCRRAARLGGGAHLAFDTFAAGSMRSASTTDRTIPTHPVATQAANHQYRLFALAAFFTAFSSSAIRLA